MRPSRHLIVPCVAILALAGAGTAAAAWSHYNAGSGQVKAVSMPAGSTPTALISGYPKVAVSWSAVTVSGAAISSYTVRRYNDTGSLQTITAGCSGAVAATTCTENSVPAGRWQYTTQPVKGAWVGTESAKSATHEIAAPPASVTCSSCTSFGSTSYINNAGKLSVSIQVALPVTSLAADTVHLTLTDTASHTVTATTQSGTAGSGTLTFNSLSTATLVDGNVTATAWVTTDTSESSPPTTAPIVRDTTGPTASEIHGTNGGTAGQVDAADSLVYTFSEPMAPASVRSGWSGSSTAVTSTITPGTLNDTITVGGTALGTVNTHVDYVMVAAASCASTIVMSGSTVTVTIGSCTLGTAGAFAALVGSSTFDWAPSTVATDLAGNPMASTSGSESGGPKANF